MNTDWHALSDDELDDIFIGAKEEVERRSVIRNADAALKTLNQQVLNARGIKPGDHWRKPTGAHDAYSAGWEVTDDNGKTWVSLVNGNVWRPGESGWREKVIEGGSPPEWVQPTGAHDAYKTGDLATFQGRIYRSLMDGNSWSPLTHPAGWALVRG